MNEKEIEKTAKSLREKFKNEYYRKNRHVPRKNEDYDKPRQITETEKDREKLKNKFRNEATLEKFYSDTKNKLYKPLIDPLKDVVSEVGRVVEAVDKTDKDIKDVMQWIPKRPTTPGTSSIPIAPGSPLLERVRALEKIAFDENVLGKVAVHYLSYANDPRYNKERGSDNVFGLYYNTNDKSFKIGNMPVLLDKDSNIKMKDQTFAGTQGLYRLLTFKTKPPSSGLFTPYDLKNYIKLMIETDSIYQSNDKTTNRVKSSVGNKYNNLIRPIYEYLKSHPEDFNLDELSQELFGHLQTQLGTGLLKYNDKEIKYIDNLTDLMNRLLYMYAQEKAGNNNFHNEKLGIFNYFVEKYEDALKGTKYNKYYTKFIANTPRKI